MRMKRNILHIFWSALLLTACTQKELPQPGTSDATPLAITITDGGYVPQASTDGLQKAVTRAAENGYRTEFTAGDACGLYVVRNGEIVYDNVKLTASTGTDGSIFWQPEAGVIPTGLQMGERYYLYYPYQEEMAGKPDPSAPDDAYFFASLINSWEPEADQSNYAEGYTASDLMTGMGTAVKAEDKLLLSFVMTHRMALAVIELPKTIYHFTNITDGGNIPDYVHAPFVDFYSVSNAKPFRTKDGNYIYIVRPGQSDAELITGRYDKDDKGMKEFNFITNEILTGSYKSYKINGAPIVEKEHNLQIGDVLLADGYLAGKDETLTPEQQASVAAIVFWTPAETTPDGRQTPANLSDDKIMSAEHPYCTHGLAVAVKDVTYKNSETIVWQSSDSQEQIKLWQEGPDFTHARKNRFVSIGSGYDATDNINRIYGYQNTVVLRAYNAYCTDNGKDSYIVSPVAALDEFAMNKPAPAGSTGWFIPSGKELHMLCYKDVDNICYAFDSSYTDTRDTVNASLSAVGGDSLGSAYYWSSSEYRDNRTNAFLVDFLTAYVPGNNKRLSLRVKAVCAF